MISSTLPQSYSPDNFQTVMYQSDVLNQSNDIASDFPNLEKDNDTSCETGSSFILSGTSSSDIISINNLENNKKILYNNNEQSSVENGGGDKYFCEICGDESDGLHFGQYSCRACAAFFRRTVSLKLEYTCKREGRCPIEKSARNMCRACRYQKCIDKGLQTTAVQHMRDGLGKRNNAKKSSNASGDMPDVKIPKSIDAYPRSSNSDDEQYQQKQSRQQPQQSIKVFNNGNMSQQVHQSFLSTQQQHSLISNNQSFSNIPTSNEYFLVDTSTMPILQLSSANISQLTTNGAINSPFLYTSNIDNRLSQSYANLENALTSTNSAFTSLQQNNLRFSLQDISCSSVTTSDFVSPSSTLSIQLKYLTNMLEGYRHFISLRKASYALIMGPVKFREPEEIPQSNFGTCKKLCRLESSLIMDIVEKYFVPFSTLTPADKNLLFDSFYCLFSNTERAYRTYKTFGPNDDRLLMPDNGYVRLSELTKFYENNSIVVGDPNQVAEIFKNAMEYIIKVVVTHMRRINLSEIELMTLFGLFIWKDTEGLSPNGQGIVERARDNILVDLHAYYRSQGLLESDVTVKSANFLLLMPKLEEKNFRRLLNVLGRTSILPNYSIIWKWARVVPIIINVHRIKLDKECPARISQHLTAMIREDYDVAIMFELIDPMELCPKLINCLEIR